MPFRGPGGMHQFFNGPRGGLTMLVFFAFVVVVGVLLFSLIMRRRAYLHHGGSGISGSSTGGPVKVSGAMQMLDERFARGEIDAEDYKTRRGLLSANS
jgi:uncharacterized membrane protein